MIAPIVIIFAIRREGQFYDKSHHRATSVQVVYSGIGYRCAQLAAARLIRDSRPRLVISAGYCGALRREYIAGDVVVPSHVVGETRVAHRCLDLGQPQQLLFTSKALLATAHDKLSIRQEFHADLVDMEASTIADECARNGVDFLAVKAVSDTAQTSLSPQLVNLVNGSAISIGSAICSIALHPWLIPQCLSLARNSRLASKHLARALGHIIHVISARTNIPSPSGN